MAQPRILAFMQSLGFWKGQNIILEVNSMRPPATTVGVVLMYLSWAVLGAFVEEVYFCGYLQSQMSFAGRFDWVLSGLMYGSHHLWVTPLIPTAMVLGLCLALIFKWRKNTWPVHHGEVSYIGRAIHHLPERHRQASLRQKERQARYVR